MASGDTLLQFLPANGEPPAPPFATFDTRNAHPVIDFDAGTQEYIIFTAVMPQHYGAGGITAHVHWAATDSTTGDVIWSIEFERIGDQSQDLDADGWAAANLSAATAAPGTLGHVDDVTITFTDGADMDSVAAGDLFRIRVSRDATNGSDTMTGDAELLMVELQET